MRTMPRKYPSPAPRGEHRRLCDYCGILWYASDLRRDAAGLYACPDDQSGRDVVTLARANQADAAAARAALALPKVPR